jgi:hypothetical protein
MTSQNGSPSSSRIQLIRQVVGLVIGAALLASVAYAIFHGQNVTAAVLGVVLIAYAVFTL